MPVFHALMFALEMSFAEIIDEGPTFLPMETLKNRPSGPTIGGFMVGGDLGVNPKI
jgi:hypothetical protein